MSVEPSLELDTRSRKGIAGLLVLLAVVHLLFPTLAIDTVFLGLLALAVLVLKFEIRSIDVLGVKATAKVLRSETAQVTATEIPTTEAAPLRPPLPPSGEAPIEHRPAVDLMPPTDPTTRVLWSVEQIRIELIVIAGNRGLLTDSRPWDTYLPVGVAELLYRENVLPGAIVTAIRSAVKQRNHLAHGRLQSFDLIQPLDELTLTLVSRLREIPREYIRVRRDSIPLYRDRSLTARHPLSPGVMLEQRDKDGKLLTVQVFPTQKQYTRSRFVSWEWDTSHASDAEAWYADPTNDHPMLAFSASTSFAGREYPDQWGLMYRGGPIIEDGID